MLIEITTKTLHNSNTLMWPLFPRILPKNMLFPISLLSFPCIIKTKSLISSNVYVEIYL